MQTLPALIFLAFTTILLMAQWILPMLNLHLALNQENLLTERAQKIVDASRLNPGNALNGLQNLVINGININQVSEENQGDYIIYQIHFNHRGLFTNKFLEQEQLERSKTLSLLSDRNYD